MRSVLQYLTVLWLPAALLVSTSTHGVGDRFPGPFVENEEMLMVMMPRTPEQMAAFYEARGFPQDAIDRIRATCFVTVHIENRSDKVIWLELKNWRLRQNGEALQRFGTEYWSRQWDEIDLPMANRSTFGWTQLPEVRDLQPDEPVGGNIVLPGSTTAFDVEAQFFTGKDRRRGMLVTRFENIRCPKDEATQ